MNAMMKAWSVFNGEESSSLIQVDVLGMRGESDFLAKGHVCRMYFNTDLL